MTRWVATLAAKRARVHFGVLSVFLALFAYLSLSEPALNWDIFAYVANAKQYIGDQPVEELHRSIYQDIQKQISDIDFARLHNTSSRATIMLDPTAFEQTIEFFYDARIIYTGILAAFIKFGMDPFFASYFISTVCAMLSVLLLARLIPIAFPMGLCFALPFVTLGCGLLTVARLSSPDALAALMTIVLYWLLIRNRIFCVLLLLPTLVFVRTDLILLMPLFLGYFFLTKRMHIALIVLSGLATVAAYLTLNHVIVDGDPWSSLIGYNYGIKPTHPLDYTFDITISMYISYLVAGLKSFSYNPMFFVICSLAVTGIFLFASRFFYNPENRPVSQQHADLLFLLVSSVAYIGIHFLLFPVTWTRFFAAQYSIVAVVVLWATLSLLAERNYSSRVDVDLMAP